MNLFNFKSTAPVPAQRPISDDEVRAAKLTAYRPGYYTVAGLVTAQFHKLTRLHNGKIGALYDIKYINPLTGKRESTRYLYGIDANGRPKEMKKLSTLVS